MGEEKSRGMHSSRVRRKTSVAAGATVLDLGAFKERRLKAHRDYIFAIADTIEFPGGQELNAETGRPCLDATAREELERIFALFGISELDPDDDDFELVVNTWEQLSETAGVLKTRADFGEKIFYQTLVAWKPLYGQYLEALWNADSRAVAAIAKEAGISAGIREGEKGPWRL